MAYVQSRVTNNIRWVSDATEWGQHDYWASASETLAHGAGDMEDRAIVKMQALRALGFAPSDLFLTLARDRVGGPITVLMARLGGRYFVLDDTGGRPFPVETARFEFQPVISFGFNGAWVHTPAAGAAAACRGRRQRDRAQIEALVRRDVLRPRTEPADAPWLGCIIDRAHRAALLLAGCAREASAALFPALGPRGAPPTPLAPAPRSRPRNMSRRPRRSTCS